MRLRGKIIQGGWSQSNTDTADRSASFMIRDLRKYVHM